MRENLEQPKRVISGRLGIGRREVLKFAYPSGVFPIDDEVQAVNLLQPVEAITAGYVRRPQLEHLLMALEVAAREGSLPAELCLDALRRLRVQAQDVRRHLAKIDRFLRESNNVEFAESSDTAALWPLAVEYELALANELEVSPDEQFSHFGHARTFVP